MLRPPRRHQRLSQWKFMFSIFIRTKSWHDPLEQRTHTRFLGVWCPYVPRSLQRPEIYRVRVVVVFRLLATFLFSYISFILWQAATKSEISHKRWKQKKKTEKENRFCRLAQIRAFVVHVNQCKATKKKAFQIEWQSKHQTLSRKFTASNWGSANGSGDDGGGGNIATIH